MNKSEIITAALALPKKDKTEVINAILASMSEKKAERKMPTGAAMEVFKRSYIKHKGTSFGVMTPAHFAALRQLLLKIEAKILETGKTMVTDSELVDNFQAYLHQVVAMPNRWYFENRFTPDALNRDFEKIYGNIKQNSSNDRYQRSCDYL